jgi:uncharacterized membrane protein
MATMNKVEEGKACAALSYILVGIIWYFVDEAMRKNEFAKFHAKQGLVLIITWIILSIVASVIPFIGWFILWPIFGIFCFVLFILGLINSLNGAEKELPVIGSFAKNFKF